MKYSELDVGLSKEVRALQDKAREFAMEVMRPAGIELDKYSNPADVIDEDSILWDVHKKFREMGFHKDMVSKAFGGNMENTPSMARPIMHEQFGYGDAGLAISLGVAGMPFAMAVLSPSAEIRDWARQYVEDTEAKMIGCWAITEPDHGSDWIIGTTKAGSDPRTAPSVRAVKKGNEYIINGRKAAWVSNGTIATHAVFHVGLDSSQGIHGHGLAFCPLDLPGISKAPPLDKVGQRPLNQGEIIFEDVKLHKKYFVIPVPAVFSIDGVGRIFLGGANTEMGITFSGLAQAAFDEALKYSKEKNYNGKPLFEQEHVRWRLFNMFTKVEAARAYSRRVTYFYSNRGGGGRGGGLMSTKAGFWMASKAMRAFFLLYDRFKDTKRGKAIGKRIASSDNFKSAMGMGKYGIASKILSTETAFRVSSEAMQLMGPDGMSKDYPVEKMFRDARAALIEDGTNEAIALVASVDL